MAQQIEMIAGGYKVVDVHKYISAENLIPFGQPISIKEIAKQRVCKESSLVMMAEEYTDQMKAPFYELGKNNTQIQLYVENNRH